MEHSHSEKRILDFARTHSLAADSVVAGVQAGLRFQTSCFPAAVGSAAVGFAAAAAAAVVVVVAAAAGSKLRLSRRRDHHSVVAAAAEQIRKPRPAVEAA